VVLAAVGLFLAPGCATDGEFGDRTAVVIYNQEPERIMEVTTRVFASRGYGEKSASDEGAVYVRAGSSMQNLAYGSWMSGKVREEATVTVEYYAPGAHMLSADVKLVENPDDEFFREDRKMSKRARVPFQEMLDEVAAILSGTPASSDAQ